ncbi:hypothetical protein [Nocardia nepalensis]|uniref:hypothetical protein n=1 Tax=Nocardia nepalensis TaxID=3375448 RepID=UPI003B68509D
MRLTTAFSRSLRSWKALRRNLLAGSYTDRFGSSLEEDGGMRVRFAHLFVVIGVAVAALTGCATVGDQVRSTIASRTTAQIPSPDADDYPERPVAMPTGQQVADLPIETSAQVLCAAATPQQWQAILGEPVTLRRKHIGGCEVLTAGLRAYVSLSDSAFGAGQPRPAIAGRPAYDEVVKGGQYQLAKTDLAIRLVDDLPTGWDLRPMLKVEVAAGNHQVESTERQAQQAAEMIVPRLIGPGPRLPGSGVYVSTPPTHGVSILDLARQVRVNQLCTVALDIIGPTPSGTTISPEEDFCHIGYTSRHESTDPFPHWWSYTISFDSQPYSPAENAEPGQLQSDGEAFAVRLTSAPGPRPLKITVSGDNGPLPIAPREFAQRLVTSLLVN